MIKHQAVKGKLHGFLDSDYSIKKVVDKHQLQSKLNTMPQRKKSRRMPLIT